MTARSAALALLLMTACSAGRPTGAPVPLASAHGSVAEVLAALEAEDLPCELPVVLPPSAEAEELTACRIGDEQVLVAHFLDVRQAGRFREAVEDRGLHGAFADTWALRTQDRSLARRVAEALRAPRRL